MKAALCLLLLLSAPRAYAEEPPRYDAQETLRGAQVGSYAPRPAPSLAPPLRILPKRRAGPSRFDCKWTCRIDPSRPLDGGVTCETIE